MIERVDLILGYYLFFLVLICLVLPIVSTKCRDSKTIKVSLVFWGLLIACMVVECLLSYGFVPANSVYYSRKYSEQVEKINENHRHSVYNPDGFNDRVRAFKRTPGVFRIAVLGDSFVWGTAVQDKDRWPRKLEQKLEAKYPGKFEILHWGLGGWSTLDEFDWLRTKGTSYDIDLVLVGFVTNDPSMDHLLARMLNLEQFGCIRPFKQIFPELTHLCALYAERVFSKLCSDCGYENWEAGLYESKNLDAYLKLLKDMGDYVKNRSLRTIFVLTPNNYDSYFQKRFEQVKPLLVNANFEVWDLFPVVKNKLSSYPINELAASPADGHPGPIVTEVYAEEVYRLIQVNMSLFLTPAAKFGSE